MVPSEGGSPKPGKVVAVLGPTGSGKSAFAIELAKALPGEIISCDSMAVYRGVDIATDKVPPGEREGVPHHLYDVAEAGSFFSAGMFRDLAHRTIKEIQGRGRVPLVVGGTGLYARALLSGISEAPARDEGVRKRIRDAVARKGAERVHRLLHRLDPERAAQVSSRDEVRITRSLELRVLTGRRFSEVMKAGSPPPPEFEYLKLCIQCPRETLYSRIEARVDKMVASGLVREAEALYRSGSMSGPAAKAIGYKELVPFFEGKEDLETAIGEIKKNSRNLAKRQITWFKKEFALEWVMIEEKRARDLAVEAVRLWVKGESHGR